MISIKVPPLGESIVEATISRWLKNEGDAIAAGDMIVELETDKITVEVPALKAGVLAKRSKNEGDVVKVDEVLGEIDETAAGASKPAAAPQAAQTGAQTGAQAGAQTGAQAGAKPAAQPAAAAPPPSRSEQPAAQAQQGARDGAQRVSPAAQRVAAESGVDVSQVAGTGRGGVVSKPDVIEHASRGAPGAAAQPGGATPAQEPKAQQPAAQQPAGQPQAPQAPRPAATAGANGARETREKMTTRRKRIAENLLTAKQATASLTTFNEVDMTAVMQLRERRKEAIEKKHGVKLTYMPFFIRACCIALKDFPNINAQIDGESILYKHYVNMGIAVASDQGLIVPNIKDADRKDMIELSADIADIAKRARDSKLTMDDLTGGTFTITNGGVFGSLVSTPIINYPQVGILGLHKIQERPMAVDGKVEIRPMMYLALTYDHRIVDGRESVQFLVAIKEALEDPARLLLQL